MDSASRISPAEVDKSLEILWQDSERVLCRISRDDTSGDRYGFMPARYVGEHPAPDAIQRLEHEYELKDYLERDWAVRPLELIRDHGRTLLAVDFQGGERLDKLIGSPMEAGKFLRLAIALSTAIGRLHARGLVHKDIKPPNILVDEASNGIWLTGFGIASRLPREHQLPSPPEFIACTLPYMAPEQTGRMNRSIDSRSDLYSLGVTLYEMFVGALPFTASDPMEWVHCHIARLPVAPNFRRAEIPEPLSAIILKLLAKAPEERYQTAGGVEADLRRCQSDLEAHGRIESFTLGARDVPDRLMVPEKLYGREKEIELLLAAFDRVVSQGTTELVLVSGYSGVGKSSVVNELHKVLVPPRGLFASGKFDQYKRDIPYATLAQAFQGLIRQILGKSDAEVARWRESLGDALGPNGQLLVNLIPEIELIIGTPPPVPDLPPQEAKNRFQRVLRRFIGVFARPEHPLALFLDDLQWLDTATLELIGYLVADPEVKHLLLVGAYRDNEVDPGHPLMRTLQEIRAAGTRVHDIVLSPLGLEDLTALVADALHCHADHSLPLAQLVHEKTGGNPFFAIQFITALTEDELIAFDSAAAAWKWDLARILTKGYTDNVVELMIGKLNRLPETTQNSLKQLACVGNSAETATLNLISGEPEEDLHTALWEAVRLGLVSRSDNTYSFAHDRIQQAAYSLIPGEQRGDVHLRIGRVLLASMTEDQLAEHLFDVANQLNRGAALLVDHDEKAHVAAIDLRAGRKAKASVAFASALAYFSAGMALLDESDWTDKYELTFNLWIERAECEFLTGALDTASQLIDQLLPRAASKVDEAAVYHLKVRLHTLKSENHDAVATALTCLRRLGIDMPAHPTQEQVQAEYETIWQILDGRSIESLIDLPLMTDPELQAAMKVLPEVGGPAFFIDGRLFCLVISRIVKVSLQHGLSDASAYGYATWGLLLSGFFHRCGDGYRFAKFACDLVEKHGFVAFKAKVYVAASPVANWAQPIATAIDIVRKGMHASIETGDAVHACYAMFLNNLLLLARNDPLDAVWRELETSLDFARRAKYADVADSFVSQQRFIATMQGRTTNFSTFGDAQFDEAAFEAQFAGSRSLMMSSCYWNLKLKARFLSANYAEALGAAANAKAVLAGSFGLIQQLDYFYYTALTVSALYETAGTDQQQAWRELLTAHQEQLREWVESYPPTFADKHALVSAEIARLEGREADAMRLYEQAIHSAREHGFVQNEGVACEVAARFYAARGVESVADAYIRNARDCYLRWGADGKVRQLDRLYPHLAAPEGQHPAAIIGPPVVQLDVETVVKASQALSSEMVLPELIEKLVRIVVEHAGAERGLLILIRDGEPRIEAVATTGLGKIEVVVCREPVTPSDLPQSVLHYVIRTQESVLLDDASADNVYSKDEYVARKRAKSVLCMPIVKQKKLVGALYLENNLAPRVFTADRVAVLQLLASQAAISLENAALYTDLQLQVGLLQKLPVSAWTVKPDGTPDFVNQVWLEFAGQTLDFVRSHPEAWMTAVHPEDREMAARSFWEGVHSGQGFAMETRSLRARDGTYRWHLNQAVVLRDSEGKVLKFVGTTTDIDDQKRTEEALRQAQAELAHVTRVTTMGELAASIAHEVNQPIAGVVVNGNTGLLWLERVKEDSVNVTEVRETLNRIIRDGERAGEIVARIRALFKKAEPAKEPLDLNEAIREILLLARSEMSKQRVALHLELADGLPLALGDKVQLQQVMLNLILNGIDAMNTIEDRSRDLIVRTQCVEQGRVTVTVRDSGIGLDSSSMEKVFAAFHTTKAGGLGMGLSISRSIVENHQGRLWATAHEGPGASFHFTLLTA